MLCLAQERGGLALGQLPSSDPAAAALGAAVGVPPEEAGERAAASAFLPSPDVPSAPDLSLFL